MNKYLHILYSLVLVLLLPVGAANADDYITEADAQVAEISKVAGGATSKTKSADGASGSADYTVTELEEGAYLVELPDPIYGFNKAILFVNMGLDRIIIRPLTTGYRAVVPVRVRGRIVNVFNNLQEPIHLANDILQAEFGQALATTWRFILNSTAGVLGLFDVATALGIEKSERTFNTTLEKYGVGPGIYIMLPILGPASTRHGVGMIADSFADPIFYISECERYYAMGAETISRRDEHFEAINDILDNSSDLYATIKAIYEQKQASKQ